VFCWINLAECAVDPPSTASFPFLAAPAGIGAGGVVLVPAAGGEPAAALAPVAEEGEGAAGGTAKAEAAADAPPASPPAHHWSQALQYLDRSLRVEPGARVALLARRDGARLRFALRAGVGAPVARAPWRVEWGGGASVENPHFQRVHYCELLVRDFLQRARSGRFPPIARDVRMVLAHCGSLFLDPAAVAEAGAELSVLERLHARAEFSAGASPEALTRRPLRWC
jgi:protein arginine N-methyltransferase 7